jgi:glycolate oxidase iron-sulfur subunit
MDPLQVVFRSTVSRRPGVGERLVRLVVFSWLFMDMARFRLFARLLWVYQRSGVRWLARHLGLLRLLGLAEAEQLLPEIPGHLISADGKLYPPVHVNGEATPAAFFAGCVMSTALADVDRASLRVLQRAGVSVCNPRGQGCCGALHAHGGDLPGALELARRNIAAFETTDGPIVVNSAGCGAMLKDYAHHLRDDPAWATRAEAFSKRVRDFSQVVEPSRLEVHGGQGPTRVVYQDACHLLHAQRISRQPRDLLRAIPGLELVEIDEPGLCCGSAGVYNVTNPVESRQLQQRKVDHTLEVAPDLVVTANPGCLLQLRSGLAARGSEVPVRHLADVLDEATAQ